MDFKKNDYVTVTIEDIGNEGEGIGKIDGYTLFIKDAVIGDVVEAKIMKSKKNYAYAHLEKVVTPSPFRVEPSCPIHKQCGGCQIQAMSYEKQLAFKESKIRNNLIRIGGFAPELIDEVMEPIVGMEEPLRYRNKAQYPIGTDKEGNLVAGFYAGRTHSIIANTDCLLGAQENKEILEVILSYMRQNHVTVYEEASGKGLVRHVLIRKGFTSGELMVCLVINLKGKREKSGYLPAQEKLVEALKRIPGMTSISVSINAENTNVIMGKEVHTIWGSDRIRDTIHVRDTLHDFALTETGITFSISPLSFYQVNPVQTEKLYSLALEYAGLTGKETVVDAYCGTGTIGMIASDKADKVIGVELNADAVRDARNNAKANQIRNIQFYQNDAGKFLVEMAGQGAKVDVVLMDPPRSGSTEEFMSSVVRIGPERIVYVSCNPETLVRDLKYFKKKGYRVAKGVGVDMFPFTEHCEAVTLLTRQKK